MSETLTFEIRRARDREEMAAALALRHDVFCVEQGVPEHEELDGRDRDGIHLVAMSGGELLGTCRVLMVGTPRSSAAWPSARRRGGTGSPPRCCGRPTRRRAPPGRSRLVLHAQTYAQPLYEHAGYRTRGRVFVEAGIKHIAMEKRL